MGNVLVYKIELPTKIKGTTIVKDGDYIVFINSLLCESSQQIALKHELMHINQNHLYDESSNVYYCEHEANTPSCFW